MAEDGRRTIVPRRRAAMAGDEPPPVHLHANHLYESMRESEENTMVGSILPEGSLSVSYRRLTAVPCSG